MRREALKALDLRTENFEIESEILLMASRKGFKIRSVPIETVYGEEHSDIHPGRDTARFFRFLFGLMRRSTSAPF